MGRGPLCCTFFFVSCFILLWVCVSLATHLPSCHVSCRPHYSRCGYADQPGVPRVLARRVEDTPGSTGKSEHSGGGQLLWWVTCGFTISASRSIGVTGSADRLKCSFPLCPENHGVNSQPLCSLLWVLFMDPLSCRAGCSWTPTCVDTITLALPLHPGSEGCVASTPSHIALMNVRQWNTHELSFLLFPNQDILIFLAHLECKLFEVFLIFLFLRKYQVYI